MPVVNIANVSKRFSIRGKNFHALKGVSFQIKRGEIFGLLGPNGAGKSTMINIMLGILEQDEGQVEIFGKKVSPEILEKMNFVSGDARFHWVLPCRDILEFYGRVYGLPKEEREKRIARLSVLFGIENILGRKFSYLSTGERMRLNFVKALLNYPELLLLDEPTLGLDPDIAVKVRKEIKRINRKFGTTILLTSHYMGEVEQLCDRIAFMRRGKIIDIGEVGRVKLGSSGSYQLIVMAEPGFNARMLKKKGYAVNGTAITKTLGSEKSLSDALYWLHSSGVKITDIETRKPTLEDYFIKMVKKR